MQSRIVAAVDRLQMALERAAPCAGLADLMDPADVALGYAIQDAATFTSGTAGRRIIGYKIGLTSPAPQAMFGATEPMRGILFADTRIADGDKVDLSRLCAPRLEGEIVLTIGAIPEAGMDDAALAATVATAHAAIEIPASRIGDWKIGIGEAIADNACCGRVGWREEGLAVDTLDLAAVAMTIRADGEEMLLAQGSGAACLGNPLAAYRWLVDALAGRGIRIAPGDVILTGALAPPVAMQRGMAYSISLSELGTFRLQT